MGGEEDKILIGRTTLKFMKYSGIWPWESEEMNPGMRFYAQVALFLMANMLWTLSVGAHFFINLRNNSEVHLSEDLSFILGHLGDYYIVILFVKEQPKVARILADLSKFDKFGKPPGLEEKLKNLSFYSAFGLIYTIMGIFVYSGIKIVQKPECERLNIERGLNEICGVLSPTWLPFKITNNIQYYSVLVYLFFASQLLLKLYFLVSFNALEIAHHIMLRIEHLKLMVEECFECKDYEIAKPKFRVCYFYHLEILSYAKRLNDSFSMPMFVHLTITAAIIGCLEKHFLDGDTRVGAVVHAGGWLLALFTACIGGQQFIDANESLPMALWSVKWYEADVRLRKDLLMMLRRSQIYSTINTGSFGFLSFPLFLSVLKMSYSIFAMLSS